MNSIELIHDNLLKSDQRVLGRVEDMRGHATVAPTPNGGCHTLWLLGHLAYSEAFVVHDILLGDANPLEAWKGLFSHGTEPTSDPAGYPSFDEVLQPGLFMTHLLRHRMHLRSLR